MLQKTHVAMANRFAVTALAAAEKMTPLLVEAANVRRDEYQQKLQTIRSMKLVWDQIKK